MKQNLRQLHKVFKLFFPECRQELIVFFFFLIVYMSYSIFIALNTSVIDSIERPYDIYFSYDNPIVYERGYVYISGHPLMKYITMPFIFLGDFLASHFGYKAKTLFAILICSVLISLSVVYVYRYLKKVIHLNNNVVYLLIGIYGFSMACLTLCFTPESFTISAFLLSFIVYFYSYYIQNDEDIGLFATLFFSIVLGGVTITNFIKGIIPLFFTRLGKRRILIRVIISGAIFFVVLLCIIVIFNDLTKQLTDHIVSNTTRITHGNIFEDLFCVLFSSPIFSSNVVLLNFPYEGSIMQLLIFEYYHYWWQYLFAGILFLLILLSLLSNYRNKLVQLLFLLILVDVIIHAILRFGISDGFIFGGHWLFLVPLILGWGYNGIRSAKNEKFILILLSILLIGLVVNNFMQLMKFINLATQYFPPYSL